MAHAWTLYTEYMDLFILFSFLGWCMECVVIRQETGAWENRGFVHGPFCIIYGFGAILGSEILQPIRDRYVLLFFVGAIGATVFEFLTAKLMLHVFGKLWWDYHNKPLNYKGILCLESSVGWGIAALLVVPRAYACCFRQIGRVPMLPARIAALVFPVYYIADFAVCLLQQKRHRKEILQNVATGL